MSEAEAKTEAKTESGTASGTASEPMTGPVERWIAAHARPLEVSDAQGPLDDLRPLLDLAAGARIVALGASTRQSHELSVAAHRMVRILVEEGGFRSVSLEGDEPERVGLDTYISTGAGDPRAMLAEARSFWRTEEILGLVHWMRAYNARHPEDPVRFARTPPVTTAEGLAGIERGLAEGIVQWEERSGDRIVHWGGFAHTAVGHPRTVAPTPPDSPPLTHRNAGSFLRERFGEGYVSVGLTFHHGHLLGLPHSAPTPPPYGAPTPPPEFAETVLGGAGPGAYLLDLRDGAGAAAPEPVRTWLDSPTRTRLVGPAYDPADDAAHHLSGGALTDWFDALAHVREVTAARPL